MRRSTRTIADHRPVSSLEVVKQTPGDTDRCITLAGLNFNQATGLSLPDISAIASSYSVVDGSDASVSLVESFIKAGLGSMELWNNTGGSVSEFLNQSIGIWLSSIGADKLAGLLDLSLELCDTVFSEKVADNKVLALIETETGGFFVVGALIDVLEQHDPGLGADFYQLLRHSLGRWVRIFDHQDAESYIERWKESVETDVDMEQGGDFDAYVKREGIVFYDVEGDTPACVKQQLKTKPADWVRHIREHAKGRYAAVLAPLLEMYAIKPRLRFDYTDMEKLGFEWDDGPVPSHLLVFHHHDAIEQCWDEEAAVYNEVSRAPSWLTTFDPSSVKELKAVLAEVEKFVQLHLALLHLQQAAEKIADKSKKGTANEKQRQHRESGQLQAA
jgi:hypothetical protein